VNRKAVAALGVFAFVLVAKTIPARADTGQILKEISDAAERLCADVSQSGSANTTQMTGDVKAELNGLAKRLANLGISGTGSITSTEYQGVLQGQLAATLKDVRDCKLRVFDVLQRKLVPDTSQPSAPAIPPIPKTDSQVHGWLKPANHPTPPNACTGDAFADRAAKVLIGDNALAIPQRGKMLVLEIKKCEALSMEMSPEGILLNATINDGSGIAPAQVVNNEVTAQNGETYYARESADESILTVKNSKGLVLLEAEFLNKSAIRIRGQFGCVGGPIVPIADGQPIPGMRMTNSCMAGFHSLLSID
jgi:hypothetical protein